MDFRRLRRPIHLILDWDGTVTRKDTLSLVASIGYRHHGYDMDGRPLATSASPNPNPNSSIALKPWNHFVNAYIDDYSAHQSQYIPKTEDRKSLQDERAWLASLSPIENRSVQRVAESRLFQGVTAAEVDEVAQQAVTEGQLELRPGWAKLFMGLREGSEKGGERHVLSILSVNWSERFIRSSLRAAAAASEDEATQYGKLLRSYLDNMNIRTNEIAGLERPTGSDGRLSTDSVKGVRTSTDKLAQMPLHCRKRLDEEYVEAGSSDEGSVVYVGDSATDLESLLAADVGICMRDEPMGSGQRELAETLARVGVEVRHVKEAQTGTRGRVVWWARDLAEIADCPGLSPGTNV
ncbi:hypothetical protein M8818_001691 [Zalaria obscura]|uniref:Uncharacterized protein n=1 Tax=Zalaria obscura TaxID=2024903 RepID=A0ACC3SJ29_9PEZI